MFVQQTLCKNMFHFGIWPGTVVARTDDKLFIAMKSGTHFSIYFKNTSYGACLCVVTVDGKEIGTIGLYAGQCCYLERPLDQEAKFTFVKDQNDASSSAVLDDQFHSERGCVKVKFIPADNRGRRSGRRQEKSNAQQTKYRSRSNLESTEDEDFKFAEETQSEHEHSRDCGCNNKQEYATGSTQFTGTSKQKVYQTSWSMQFNEDAAEEMVAYLVAL